MIVADFRFIIVVLCALLCKCALYVDNYVVYAVAKVSLNYKKIKWGGKYMLTALN